MQIEAGKKYYTRGGAIIGPANPQPESYQWPWHIPGSGSFGSDGRFNGPHDHPLDLVSALAQESPDEDDARDAARWRALLGSQRIRMLGWTGFDQDGNVQPSTDPRGYMHFGVEFWSQHPTMEVARARTILTSYADALIAQR